MAVMDEVTFQTHKQGKRIRDINKEMEDYLAGNTGYSDTSDFIDLEWR